MRVTITFRKQTIPTIPIEAEMITPDAFFEEKEIIVSEGKPDFRLD